LSWDPTSIAARLIYVAKGFQQVSASRRERGPRYRGTPTGIDLMKVVESGVTPIMDIGIAGRNGGQIGAGLVRGISAASNAPQPPTRGATRVDDCSDALN
jgi:hypothetical protein